MKYAFISRNKLVWPICVQCRVLLVSVSGYHEHLARRVDITQRRHLSEEALLDHISAVYAENRGAYGWPRIWRQLLAQGMRVGKLRVQLLMQKHGIQARGKRKFSVTTTDSRHDLPIAPNLLDRNFIVAAPNMAWVGDFTSIATEQGWLFLAVVIDLFSRSVGDHSRGYGDGHQSSQCLRARFSAGCRADACERSRADGHYECANVSHSGTGRQADEPCHPVNWRRLQVAAGRWRDAARVSGAGQGALDVAHAEVRRTDLELTKNVVRLYYGAVLARQLHRLGKDTLDRMEATLTVAEFPCKDGTGTVNKTDYLDNKVMVETIRSIVAPLEANEASAEAALAYTIGLSWKSSVAPKDEGIPYQAHGGNLDELVSTAYEFNPDWAEIDAGLRALKGERATTASGYYPKIGLKGDLHRLWNSYGGGFSTSSNKDGWSVDLGVEIPVFDGFLIREKVAEARARINQFKEKKLPFAEGLGLQIRSLFLDLEASEKIVQGALW